MDCPKCVGVLEKQKLVGIEVDECYMCEGIWFDAGELEDVIKRDSENFDYIDVGREQFDGKEFEELAQQLNEKVGSCPRCGDGTLLLKSEYNGKKGPVIVDICPNGHGVWLDGGEILQLRKRGLVNVSDKTEFYMDFVKYLFSKDGFNDTVRGSARMIRNLLEGRKYNEGLTKETAMEKED